MTRPLRRRHRGLIATLFLFLAVAALLALTHPAPSARVPLLPLVVSADGSRTSP